MANMFGLIVSGRLVQTSFDQVGEAQFVTTITEADSINHIVIFLTGTIPFPEHLGGSVYFSWPSETGPPSWHLLGNITNNKPSAIFKISGIKKSAGASPNNFFTAQTVSHAAQIGISVEPLTVIEGQTPAVNEASTTSTYIEFSRSMCDNLFNYMSSFSQSPSCITPSPSEQYLPMSALTRWYENFSKKLQHNPNFWKK